MKNIFELIKRRKKFAEAIIENDYDLSTVLVGLYADPSHFIYEILQNAEDCEATEISFELNDDKLVINHNGKDFNENDIETITAIALKENEKKEQLDKIGRFGIGFKSVYAITSTPRIQSGKYDFVITQFVLPDKFTDNNSYKETTITLPFDHIQRSKTEIYEMILKKFELFEVYNLLFLSNLKLITFIYNKQKEVISRKSSKYKNSVFAEKVSISLNGSKIEYLLFKSEVKNADFQKLKNKQYCAVAFQLNEKDEIVKSNSSNLFVFFETGYETFLNFLVHAPFVTTPPRDNIIKENPLNDELITEVNDLIKNILIFCSENNLININFLQQLPLNSGIDKTKIFYWSIFKAVKSELSSGRDYFPIINKKDLKPSSDVLLVRGRELTSIISSVEDLEELFGRKYWVDTDITEARMKQLWDYLKNEMGIPEIAPIDFARRMTDEYLKRKNNSWFMRLYEFLSSGQDALWRSVKATSEGPLRRKAFIRLEDGTNKNPFDHNGKPIVYLPVENSKLTYDSVSPEVIVSKNAKEFIRDRLGIREPNLFDEIKYHILPLYRNSNVNISAENHLEHIDLIINYYHSTNEIYKSELAQLFKDMSLKFFMTNKLNSNEIIYQSYDKVYFPIEDLKQYFGSLDEIYYLDTASYSNLDQDKLKSFFISCAIREYPRIFRFKPDFEYDKLRLLRESSIYRDGRTTNMRELVDYRLIGLDEILNQDMVSLEDSVIIWEMLIKSLSNNTYKTPFIRGEYRWFYFTERSTTFKSHILNKLESSHWLYSNNNLEIPFMPSEVSISSLNEKYDVTSAEALYLISHLNFKTDVFNELIEQLTDDDKEQYLRIEKLIKLSQEKGIAFDEIYNKLLSQITVLDIKDEIDNAPSLEDITPIDEEFQEFDNSNASVKEPEENTENVNGDGSNGDINDKKDKKPIVIISQQDRDALGSRGEKIIMGKLKEFYSKKYEYIEETEQSIKFTHKGSEIKIIHLNAEDEKKGTGCDIIVKKDDEIVEYIEVKSTKTNERELYSVTGYQWALAQKLYDNQEGNKYIIYVVKEVLNDKPRITRIQNPIRKWKDGKLYAHPVNLKL